MALRCPIVANSTPDYSSLSAAELVQLGEHEREARERLGRICAGLHDQHSWTWAQIGTAFGMHLTTARRLAQPYLTEPDE